MAVQLAAPIIVPLAAYFGVTIPYLEKLASNKGVDLSSREYDPDNLIPYEKLFPELAELNRIKNFENWSGSFYKTQPVVGDTDLSGVVVQAKKDDDEVIDVTEEELEMMPRTDVSTGGDDPDPEKDPKDQIPSAEEVAKKLAEEGTQRIINEMINKLEKKFNQLEEKKKQVPSDIEKREKFYKENVGTVQRGAPEEAMLKAQMVASPVLSDALEHIGDLTHRITEFPFVFGTTKEKVKKMIRALDRSEEVWGTEMMSFLDDHEQSIRSTAKHRKISVEEYKEKLNSLLGNYVAEHEKIPTYNEMQEHAKQAAIAMGNLDVDTALEHLRFIQKEIDKGKESFVKKAQEFFMDVPDPKRIGTTGQYVGLPKGIDTPKKLKNFRDEAYKLFDSGKYGRYWYRDSANTILNSVQGDVVEADKIAQLIGLFSAGSPVGSDVTYAMQAYNAYKNGEDIFTGRFPTAQSKKAKTILDGGTWEGRKTNNFYKAIAKEFNPELTNEPVVDIWIMRAFGFEDFDGTPTDAQYKSVGNEVKRIANQMIKENPSWNMDQVQASIWVAIKARTVGEEKAKFNYKDAIENNLAQLSWESAPGDTTGHLEGFDKLSYNDKVEYHVETSKILLDDKGEDILAKTIGILSPNEFEAPGHYKEEVNPSTQKEIIAPQKYKDGKVLDPNIVKMINAYAASKGLVLHQNAMAWHRPFWTNTKSKADGVHITIGEGDKTATIEETKQISAVANRIATEMAGLDINDFNLIGTKDGGRFLNVAMKENEKGEFVPIFSVKQFQNIIYQATHEFFEDKKEVPYLNYFANSGNYIENNWRNNKNGETYLETIKENTPHLYERILNILATLIEKKRLLDGSFSRDKNLKLNIELNQDIKSITHKKRRGGMIEIPHFHYGGFVDVNRL